MAEYATETESTKHLVLREAYNLNKVKKKNCS